jgi:hypothetical protein
VEKALNSWPLDKIPVVLDVLRVMALHPVGVRRFLDSKFLLRILDRATEEGVHAAGPVLGFRLVANCFSLESARPSITPFAGPVAQKVLETLPKANLNARLAIASALLNFAGLNLATNNQNDSAALAEVLVKVLVIVAETDADGELSLILLSALGTSCYWNAKAKSVLNSAASILEKLSQSTNVKTQQAARDVKNLPQ